MVKKKKKLFNLFIVNLFYFLIYFYKIKNLQKNK